MSRIGKTGVDPRSVDVEIDNHKVVVKGPGVLERVPSSN